MIAAIPTNPDAELIHICQQHAARIAAVNRDGAGEAPGDPAGLTWLAYERSRDAIHAARPRTIEGLRAKALAAKAEAQMLDGTEEPDGTPAAAWAWDLLNDLLLVTGAQETEKSGA